METYILCYFDVDSCGWLTRALLSLAEVEYKNVFPDWPADKAKTPFGRFPVLTEIAQDGSKFVIAESRVIELYLADKFGFLPKDREQRTVVMQYYFQVADVFEWFEIHTFYFNSEISREKYTNRIKTFIERHEPILAQSKSGYYYGDSLTLPDIFLYYLYKTITGLQDQSLNYFATEQIPAISRLIAKVEENTSIKEAFMSYIKK
ncbi:hypothetical protein BB560_005844 [Smittium megazygosporum]|uniref:Glutathione S-transferase n=1 Tax=Smittium megazygosporum TaxID=133381 RepID=A0A2T9YTZ8_9FUNG|nr:hypothetical protein BB560_005844 [Smittium megazygosporum]